MEHAFEYDTQSSCDVLYLITGVSSYLFASSIAVLMDNNIVFAFEVEEDNYCDGLIHHEYDLFVLLLFRLI